MQLARRRAAHSGPPASAEPVLVTWSSLTSTFALAAAATLAVAWFAVSWGTVHIAPQTTLGIVVDHLPFVSTGPHSATAEAIVWQVRMPRVVLAGLVGATLGFAGAAYQGIFRNPLAEPYLLGVASGAAVGATLIIISPLYVAAWVFSPLPPAQSRAPSLSASSGPGTPAAGPWIVRSLDARIVDGHSGVAGDAFMYFMRQLFGDVKEEIRLRRR